MNLMDGPHDQFSSYWAYNQPGWQPMCRRCHKRGPAKKYNSLDLGRFAGEWVCAQCVRPDDVKTDYQRLIDKEG